jgi:hypothetical protein
MANAMQQSRSPFPRLSTVGKFAGLLQRDGESCTTLADNFRYQENEKRARKIRGKRNPGAEGWSCTASVSARSQNLRRGNLVTLFAGIRKAQNIFGHTIALRDATASDASFILNLLSESNESCLTPTSPELDKQLTQLQHYSKSTDQVYFIILESSSGGRLGTERIYDLPGAVFCWGSWILKVHATRAAAIESAPVVHASEYPGLRQPHITVRNSMPKYGDLSSGWARATSQTRKDTILSGYP